MRETYAHEIYAVFVFGVFCSLTLILVADGIYNPIAVLGIFLTVLVVGEILVELVK